LQEDGDTQRGRRTKRLLILTFATGALAYVWYVASGLAEEHSLDPGYRRLELGQRAEDVEASMGTPHEVHRLETPLHGIQRFYYYRVHQWGSPLKRASWSIGIDAAGQVVSRHRGNGGC
jgi:hypothetical protein